MIKLKSSFVVEVIACQRLGIKTLNIIPLLMIGQKKWSTYGRKSLLRFSLIVKK